MAFIGSSKSKPATEPEARAPARATGPGPRSGSGGVDSLIANGMTINGDCETSGVLRVEGHVRGSVRASRLRITETGRVDGDVAGEARGADETVVIDGQVKGAVRATRVEVGSGGAVGAGLTVKEAVVRGRVTGPVVAETRLILEETAMVEGDVTASRLAVKEGGQVSGVIRIGDKATKSGPSAQSA